MAEKPLAGAPVAVVDPPAAPALDPALTSERMAMTHAPQHARPIAPAPTIIFDDERVRILKETMMPTATDAELEVFTMVCRRTGLDPFARQIHAVKRTTKRRNEWVDVWSFQTGIDGYRLIAGRTGYYRGQLPIQWCGEDGVWRDVWLSKETPLAARAAVLHAQFDEPLVAVAHYHEYVQLTDEYERGAKTGNKIPNSMWLRMPASQLGKCAEALALRKAFPQELTGLYTDDEMAQADNDRDDDPEQRANRSSSSRRHAAAASSAPAPARTKPASNFENGTAILFPYGPLKDRGVTLDARYLPGATRIKKGKGGAPDQTIECGGEYVVSEKRLNEAGAWAMGKLKASEKAEEDGKRDEVLDPADAERLRLWAEDCDDELRRRELEAARLVAENPQSGAGEDEQRARPTSSSAESAADSAAIPAHPATNGGTAASSSPTTSPQAPKDDAAPAKRRKSGETDDDLPF